MWSGGGGVCWSKRRDRSRSTRSVFRGLVISSGVSRVLVLIVGQVKVGAAGSDRRRKEKCAGACGHQLTYAAAVAAKFCAADERSSSPWTPREEYQGVQGPIVMRSRCRFIHWRP
jgi:hypothetical protein